MPDFELDKWALHHLHDLYRRGRLNIRPPYQRGRAWSDPMRYALIDTITSDFPMGVILLNVLSTTDEEGNEIERWETVDGQQRCTPVFEYLDGEAAWTVVTPPSDISFSKFNNLSLARQDRVRDYQVPIALLRNYSEEQIREIFVRIQYGRALQIGEKVKALNTPYRPYLEELTLHRLFNDWGAPHQYRDTHWALAAAFLQAAFRQRPLARQEYIYLERFLRDQAAFDPAKVSRAAEEAKWIMNFASGVLTDAMNQRPSFRENVRTQRLMKWLFPALAMLKAKYALPGKEPDVASGLLCTTTTRRPMEQTSLRRTSARSEAGESIQMIRGRASSSS